MRKIKHTFLLLISLSFIQATVSEIKALLPQTINFAPLSSQTYGDLSFNIIATGGDSGNPIIFTSSNDLVATCTGTNGSTITILSAGICTITANQLGDATYSDAIPVIQTLTVNPKALTITGISVDDKQYDATKDATYNNGILIGVINSDDITLVLGTAEFTSKTVGLNKPVAFSGFSIIGSDIGNYQLDQPLNTVADISVAPLTILDLSTLSRAYDGTIDVSITEGHLSGLILADDVTLVQGFGEMENKIIGTNKVVHLSGYSLLGYDAENYDLTQPNDLTTDIFQANLDISGVVANDKDYDGTSDCTLSGGILIGKIPTDAVTLNYGTALFIDKFVGENKTVNVSNFTISGADAGNYNLIQPTGFKANIFKATPIITWQNPDDILVGTPLTSTQLNASTTVAGALTYTPDFNAILNAGNDQILSVHFTPTDNVSYNSSDETVLINVLSSTSLKNNLESSIKIYPNPASSFITISNIERLTGLNSGQIAIVDIIGNTLLTQTIEVGTSEATIDLSNMKSGVYFIVIESNQNKIIKRFFKQ